MNSSTSSPRAPMEGGRLGQEEGNKEAGIAKKVRFGLCESAKAAVRHV